MIRLLASLIVDVLSIGGGKALEFVRTHFHWPSTTAGWGVLIAMGQIVLGLLADVYLLSEEMRTVSQEVWRLSKRYSMIPGLGVAWFALLEWMMLQSDKPNRWLFVPLLANGIACGHLFWNR